MRAIEALRNLCYIGKIGFIFPKFDADGWNILEEEEGSAVEFHLWRLFIVIGWKRKRS